MPSRTDVRQSAATIKPSAVADAASAISELRRRGVYCRRYGPVVLPLADASLGPAIVGLVGVTLGALISGVFGWRGEAHRERRRARAAARLLRSDLFMFSRLLRNGIARREVPGFIDLGLPSWREHRDLLADALDDEGMEPRVLWLLARAYPCRRATTRATMVSRG